MKPLVIISCGAVKRNQPCEAQHLYTGPYFRALLSWALSVTPSPNVRILSAKHGLLRLTEIVAPYNVRMGDEGSITSSALAMQMSGEPLLAGSRAPVLFAGGKAYMRTLKAAWPSARPVIPEGLGMGRQLQWCRLNKGKVPDGSL